MSQPSGLLVPYRPAVVAVAGADAGEATGLFQVATNQPGDITRGL
ncbi:hypothetical protein ACLRGI_07995 [Paenarthrobacter nitroguajacolicus]